MSTWSNQTNETKFSKIRLSRMKTQDANGVRFRPKCNRHHGLEIQCLGGVWRFQFWVILLPNIKFVLFRMIGTVSAIIMNDGNLTFISVIGSAPPELQCQRQDQHPGQRPPLLDRYAAEWEAKSGRRPLNTEDAG